MDDARSLREQRDELAGKMNDILLRNDSIDDVESIELLEQGEARLAEMDTQIRGAEAREKVSALVKKPSFGFTPGAGTAAREDRRYRFEMNGTEIKITGGNPDVRVNPLGGGSDGSAATFESVDGLGAPVTGASIPVDLLAQMIRKLPRLAVLRQNFAVRTYSNDVELQRVNARIEMSSDATLPVEPDDFIAESGAYAGKIGSFERVRVRNFKTAAKSSVTEEFLRDARGNAVQEMLLQHAEEHGLQWDAYYATGVGEDLAPEPVFLTPTAWSTAYNTAASGSTTAADAPHADIASEDISIAAIEQAAADAVAGTELAKALTSLRYDKIPAQYWGGLKWIMGQETFAAISAIVDNNGRPLYQPLLTSTVAETNYVGTLLGLPVSVSNNLPGKTAGQVAAVLAHTEDYGIFDRSGFSQLLDPYTQAGDGEVRYLTRMRSDGRWLRPYAAGQLVWAS
jgi:HK97 family phage major capsid protein